MSEENDSIWDGEEWEVVCPPSIPLKLWEQVPEEFQREFIIEAALKLRQAIHPIYTFEDMLEEKGIPFKSVIDNEPEMSDEYELSQPVGKVIIKPRSLRTPKPVETEDKKVEKNGSLNKLWPAKTSLNSDSKKDSIDGKSKTVFGRPSLIGMSSRLIK